MSTLVWLRRCSDSRRPRVQWRSIRATSIAAAGHCSSNRARGHRASAGLFRYDAFADQSLDTSEQHRAIAGAAYWFVRTRTRIGFVATNERVSYDAPERLDENRLLFQTHIEF
jgi:hypothetical protein